MSNLYNLEFYEKMLRQNSKHAEQISKIRWNFINELNPKVILDFGSGVGFFRAFRPEGVEIDTIDIGQYPQTGIQHNKYDVVCFWDVLEHMPNLLEVKPYLAITNYVATTLPIITEDTDLTTFKHFKPQEHLHYFTERTLCAIFKAYGFTKIKSGKPECKPEGPREDVMSFIFSRFNINNIEV